MAKKKPFELRSAYIPRSRRSPEEIQKERIKKMTKEEKLELIEKKKEHEMKAWDFTIQRYCNREGYEEICNQARNSKEKRSKELNSLIEKLQKIINS